MMLAISCAKRKIYQKLTTLKGGGMGVKSAFSIVLVFLARIAELLGSVRQKENEHPEFSTSGLLHDKEFKVLSLLGSKFQLL